MKYKILLPVFIAMAAASMTARASAVSGAHIQSFSQTSAGVVDVYLDTSRTGVPSCAGSFVTLFRFDATTTGGQATLAALYLAYASGYFVDMTGTGTCIGNVESISYFAIRKQ